MGLLFPFPISLEETDHAIRPTQGHLILKTYGLPYLFWFYLLALYVALIGFTMAVWAPALKLMATGDPIDKALGIGVLVLLFSVAFGFLSFFFYEKWIEVLPAKLIVRHRFFFTTVHKSVFPMNSEHEFEVVKNLESPNMAKLTNDPTLRGFQNNGYYQLYLKIGKRKIYLDRHNRKQDLEKLVTLIETASH